MFFVIASAAAVALETVARAGKHLGDPAQQLVGGLLELLGRERK